MKKILLIFLIILSSIGAFAHIELMGEFLFEKTPSGQLILSGKIDKSLLTKALKTEGNCAAKDMVQVCGNSYFKENFRISINGKMVNLEKVSIVIEKDFVSYSYKLDSEVSNPNSISVENDLIYSYNDHSQFKVLFNISDDVRYYSMRANKRSITVNF